MKKTNQMLEKTKIISYPKRTRFYVKKPAEKNFSMEQSVNQSWRYAIEYRSLSGITVNLKLGRNYRVDLVLTYTVRTSRENQDLLIIYFSIHHNL